MSLRGTHDNVFRRPCGLPCSLSHGSCCIFIARGFVRRILSSIPPEIWGLSSLHAQVLAAPSNDQHALRYTSPARLAQDHHRVQVMPQTFARDVLPPLLRNLYQALIFAAVFAGLGAGTVAVLAGLHSLEAALPAGWYSAWTLPLGLIFSAAGVSHFTLLKEFCNIYPGRGAWGFWYLPGTSSFHVKWTGLAELAGGIGLALGGFGVGAEVGLGQAAAAGLFVLTLAVTPANIYMFSHGAQLPEGVEIPVAGHAVRGFFQCVLLAFFWTLANS